MCIRDSNRYLIEAAFPNEVLKARPFYESRFGGTRYNNMARHFEPYRDDKTFMWRSKTAVDFCTKGIDTFFYAYEETGDPRMAVAIRWQTVFSNEHVHTNTGQCRNIGDVADYVRLYEFTGRQDYLDHALRLFRELRTKLADNNLFTQGGAPFAEHIPFIDDDQHGYNTPHPKAYIMGYALAGLPALASYFPDEPRLKDTVRAVTDFMAKAQDPAGGWRYPHPRSSRLNAAQGVEHAMQVKRSAQYLEQQGEPIGKLLDVIECTLQARILVWAKSGTFFSSLQGWERSTGFLKKTGKSIYDLYEMPEDRDPSRDYTEGSIGLGSASPDGVVYFAEILDFYLTHRPAERLFNANPQLQAVLNRIQQKETGYIPPEPTKDYIPYGLDHKLPTFREKLLDRLTYPLGWNPKGDMPFETWRAAARAKLFECLLPAPPRASFKPAIIAREDRGSYEARKLVFNVSTDCRIPAYMLVPKGKGPFPAVIALHDHGACFLIGKEKVIRPINARKEIADFCDKWVETCYGGRFVGDELAKRGYVVFAIDALFWGERGRKDGPEYDFQQAFSSNLLQMGMTWIGAITWDDIRSAEFLAAQPEVDPDRIGATGLSMGSHRTWMLAAASDRIKAAVAVCWMSTTSSLMSPGNNQAKGHSAYSMLVPNLRNFLDYPDVASIACPKPLMFYNGQHDKLFPVEGVEAAYARMHEVWQSRNADDKLVTKIWPVRHVYNLQMQEEAFDWLDRYLKIKIK